MTVNFSFLGKCEVLLKNGGGTYVDTGEYSIDYGTASREADEFYYPRAQYHGMELILYPCPELDKELSLNGRNTKMIKRTVSGKRDTIYFKSRCKN